MSASLIGGLGAGPVAAGSGSGLTLALTLTRDITANCVLHFVFGAGTFGEADFPDFPDSVSDPASLTWVVSSSTKALIGLSSVGGGSGATAKEIQLGSALAVCTAGALSTGDTVTMSFDPGISHPADLETVGMIFAVTGASDDAEVGWHTSSGGVNPGTEYADSLTTTGTGTGLSLRYLADAGFQPSPDHDAAILTAILGTPQLGTVSWGQATAIGSHTSTHMTLAVGLIPFVAGGTDCEPGGSWVNAADYGTVNFQGLVLSSVNGVVLDAAHRTDS
jgi:hypothetical protein